MFVPFFSDLMGLMGAISSCIIVFLVPTICPISYSALAGGQCGTPRCPCRYGGWFYGADSWFHLVRADTD
ncbi:hypothetical protein DSO57_1039501 [Entomophthora muscae]|uniref:Uncharacterized protein n=1 Tax=Entomophthora muscae TaxID=34485 RepID=A0ACC2U7F4_9FUNG|nr:hypothetical protein DSO57_1039501 [Entomophthora muscae]